MRMLGVCLETFCPETFPLTFFGIVFPVMQCAAHPHDGDTEPPSSYREASITVPVVPSCAWNDRIWVDVLFQALTCLSCVLECVMYYKVMYYNPCLHTLPMNETPTPFWVWNITCAVDLKKKVKWKWGNEAWQSVLQFKQARESC